MQNESVVPDNLFEFDASGFSNRGETFSQLLAAF